MVIDFHVHLGPSLALGVNVTPDEVLRQMGEAGVDIAVVFPFPSTAVTDPSIVSWVAEQAERFGRFIPFYYAPDDLEPPRDDRFRGVKWHWVRGVSDAKSNYSVLSDPKLDVFAGEVARRRLPVIFEEELEFTSIFVDRYPDVTLVIPHLGMLGGSPLDFLRRFKSDDNVYFDTSLGSPGMIRRFVEELGAHRVIFGSDIPFGYMRSELWKVKEAGLSEEEYRMVVGGNAARLMRLELALKP